MFNLFKKDPVKVLDKQYRQLLEEAQQLQRSGDIKGYALKTQEAEDVLKQIETLENRSAGLKSSDR